jgi:hypothetical protein
MTSTGRVARLTALALATGTLVAAGAGTAGASSTQKTDFTASGGGSVIHLTVNLPSQLGDALNKLGVPQTLTQDIVLTGGTIRTSDVKAIATSTLGANGNVVALSDLLNKSVTAEYGKPAPAPFSVIPQQLKDGLAGFGINVEALALNSTANNPTVDGQLSHSKSTVTALSVDGAGVLDTILAQVTAQLQAVLATALGTTGFTSASTSALGTASAVTDAAQGYLGTVFGAINTATGNALVGQTSQVQDTIKATVAQVLTQLNNLPNVLGATLKSQADTSLLKVGLIESEQSVDRAAGVVTSTSSNKLVGLSVLGGLVTVNGLTSQASAALGDNVHKATADPGQNAVLDANVADLLHVTLGKDLGINVSGLPTEVQGPVQTVLNQVSSLVSGVLGATLTQTKADKPIITSDHVASSVSAAHLTINPTLPLPTGAVQLFDKPLLDIQFVPATADVVKANGAVPPQVTPATAHSTPVFAPTGANFALTAPIAISLMGLAVVARRRRLAHLG